MINWLSKTVLLLIRYQALVDQSLKDRMIQTKRYSGKKISNTSGLVKKTNYNTKITEIENDIPRVAGLVTTTVLNAKATEIENEIPDITNLAATDALNTKAADVEIKYLRLLICLSRLI